MVNDTNVSRFNKYTKAMYKNTYIESILWNKLTFYSKEIFHFCIRRINLHICLMMTYNSICCYSKFRPKYEILSKCTQRMENEIKNKWNSVAKAYIKY